MDNPYLTILDVMKKEGQNEKPSISLGKVVNPTTIQVNDLQITKENLYFADYLLEGYKRKVTVNGTSNTYITKDTLQQGDIVAVVPIHDMQTYIILAKVAKA
ncbi:DUF2577 family protein [Clostridium tetani]|uniref:DUF2577 family protein n=1 Tax=Clostridium tetani TaxID=1513 RepID=UPI001026ABE2|nr:DUF2577 family protein [Clostridium tetani]RXI70496.1 hypothetical protein DP127_09365 [Clostridium tetani]